MGIVRPISPIGPIRLITLPMILLWRTFYGNVNRSGKESSLGQPVIIQQVMGTAAFGEQIARNRHSLLREHLFEPLPDRFRSLFAQYIIMCRIASFIRKSLD